MTAEQGGEEGGPAQKTREAPHGRHGRHSHQQRQLQSSRRTGQCCPCAHRAVADQHHSALPGPSSPLIPPHPLPWPLLLRGRDDKTGYEPRGLFNVVEFVMNDKKGNGFITLEEAMQVGGWRSAGFRV